MPGMFKNKSGLIFLGDFPLELVGKLALNVAEWVQNLLRLVAGG